MCQWGLAEEGITDMKSDYTIYDVDIVMCIDATGSMGPLLDLVKNQAKNLYKDIQNKMQEKDKYIDNLHVRIVMFRDYLADGDEAMRTSAFLRLPEQEDAFCQLIDSIKCIGGGDILEDGLEALGYAIRSRWSEKKDNKLRQIIVVWTDDGTHEIGYGKAAPNYPSNMAKSFAELTRWWGYGQMTGYMDNDAKRLLLYAPLKDYWTTIANTWDNTMLFETETGSGWDKLTYEEILDAIAGSI